MNMLRRVILTALLSAALLLGAQALDTVSVDGIRGLEGRHFLVLGDSYTASYGLGSPDANWPAIVARENGMTLRNFAISGSTICAAPPGAFESMALRSSSLPDFEDLDFIILQGGSNDYMRDLPLGSRRDRVSTTFCGALRLTLDNLTEKYPGVPIIGFSPWITDETTNGLGLTQQDYTDAMLSILEEEGHILFDASDLNVSHVDMSDRSFRADYCLTPGDWYHLNEAGHRYFADIMAAWLRDTLYPTDPEDRFYDLGEIPELRQAVGDLTASGILSGVSPHLFAPTRAATRQTLAVILYRLAGKPEATEREIWDVSPDSAAYPAVCWAMDAGLFAESDWFDPGGTLTREMLTAVAYRYYTGMLEGSAERLTGLGAFRDGSSVSDYARLSMGWALEQDILTPLGDRLAPQGSVSRGQLALSAEALKQLEEAGEEPAE